MHSQEGPVLPQLRFRNPEDATISGKDWFGIWGFREPGRDERVYQRLIRTAKERTLNSEEFELIGRWKDGAWTERQWQSHVARVAFNTWQEIAQRPPPCPDPADADRFLSDWSNRLCRYSFGDGTVERRFGLPRATTLLHFISAGRYPILDSRVREAVKHLGALIDDGVESYLASFCPLFQQIAVVCGTDDVRLLDQALVRYGGFLVERRSTNY